MKRFYLLLIVLILAIALCACTTNTTDPTVTTGHTHSYTAAQKSATCIHDGSVTYTCACGHSYEETLLAIGHDYGEATVVEKPTMTQTGVSKRICNSCKTELLEDIPVHTLEEQVADFLDSLITELPKFNNVEALSGVNVFGWVLTHCPTVSWDMNEDYLITIVYSIDDMDNFTQQYLGRIFDYTYILEANKDYLSYDAEKREITIKTGGSGGGFVYTTDSITDRGDGTYTARYLAVDPFVEEGSMYNYDYYGNLVFKIVDGRMQLISHTIEEK